MVRAPPFARNVRAFARLLLSLIDDAGLNKLDSPPIPASGLIIVSVLMPYGRLLLQQEYYSGKILSEIIHFRPEQSERSQER